MRPCARHLGTRSHSVLTGAPAAGPRWPGGDTVLGLPGTLTWLALEPAALSLPPPPPGTSPLALFSSSPARSWRWMTPRLWGRSWVSTRSLWCAAWWSTASSSCLCSTSSSPKRTPLSSSGASCRLCSSHWPPPPGSPGQRKGQGRRWWLNSVHLSRQHLSVATKSRRVSVNLLCQLGGSYGNEAPPAQVAESLCHPLGPSAPLTAHIPKVHSPYGGRLPHFGGRERQGGMNPQLLWPFAAAWYFCWRQARRCFRTLPVYCPWDILARCPITTLTVSLAHGDLNHGPITH